MPKRINKKIIISISATAVTVIFLVWLVVFFLGNKVKESFENFQKEKLNSFVLEEKRDKILKLKRDLPDLEEQKNRLNAMFIKKNEAVPFLRSLEKVASDASCSIKTETVDFSKIKFQKKSSSTVKKQDEDELDTDDKQGQAKTSGEENKKEDSLTALRNYPAFSIEVMGNYSSLIDFFERFENMPYFVQPLIIDISSQGKTGSAAARTETVASGAPVSSEEANPEEKNIKMMMTFVIYGE